MTIIYNYLKPVIIIGAARTGTKMLRALIASSSEFVSVPYDINYIWKYGNFHINHDELTSSNLDENIINYIHKQFFKIVKNQKNKRIVEKTVSNSLRVDFVKSIFPESKIIHIIRDGRDVAESAKRCWEAPLNISYIIEKASSFPIKDAWKYAFQYIKYSLSRFFNKKDSVKSWGPRFKGIDEIVQKYSLIEVCGLQWLKCVESTLKKLEKLNSGEYIQVKYENLVSNPISESKRISDFLEIKDFNSLKKFALKETTDKNIGKWKTNLSNEEKNLLIPHIRPMLVRLNYLEA